LLSYPLLVEPNLRLANQSWVWMAGYGVLILFITICGWLVWRSGQIRSEAPEVDAIGSISSSRPKHQRPALQFPTPGNPLRWIALATVPSSLLLGVTTYITTDIAPIPFLWIIPLSLYLVTFIFVFSRVGPWLHLIMVPFLPVVLFVIAAIPWLRESFGLGL